MKKMMLTAVLLYAMQTQAQTATATQLEYQRKIYAGATIDIPFEKSITEDAIDAYMVKKGSKGKNTSGYRLYKNVPLTPTMNDVYIDVRQKSKRESSSSSIYMITSSLKGSTDNKITTDTADMPASMTFLNNLVHDIAVYKAENDIQTQEDLVKKTGKKLESLQSDKKDYEKKLESTKTKLQKNNTEVKNQQTTVLQLSDTAIINKSADALQKQKKKLASLQGDNDDYTKKIADLESKLKSTKNDITQTQNDLQTQRKSLEKLQEVKKDLLK